MQNIFDRYAIMDGFNMYIVRNLSKYGKIRKGCRSNARVLMLDTCLAKERFEQIEGFFFYKT
jgi:hypothetical protein